MRLLAGVIVGAFGLLLIGLAGLVFAKPALAERFFRSFASSARAHYIEQVVRLLCGVSLVALSPAMWQAAMFRVIGWAITISSAALLLMPWRWHHRFGQRVLPVLVRHMRWYAVGLFAFGALLVYGALST